MAGGITAVVATRGGEHTDSAAGSTTTATTAVTAGTSTTTPPAPPPPPTTTTPPPAPVDDADLPTLLLPPDQVSSLAGVPLTANPAVSAIANDSGIVTPTQCISVLMPVQRLALDNTGFRAAYTQQFSTGKPGGPSAVQAVVSFPSPEMAAAFITPRTTTLAALRQHHADRQRRIRLPGLPTRHTHHDQRHRVGDLHPSRPPDPMPARPDRTQQRRHRCHHLRPHHHRPSGHDRPQHRRPHQITRRKPRS